MAHWSRPSKPTLYAGPTTCLRCEKKFQSWDRHQNRVCPRGRNEVAQEPSDEPQYRLFKRRPSPTDD